MRELKRTVRVDQAAAACEDPESAGADVASWSTLRSRIKRISPTRIVMALRCPGIEIRCERDWVFRESALKFR
jgi:hypothetical protein